MDVKKFIGYEICDAPLSYWGGLILGSINDSVRIIVTPNVDHFSRLENDDLFRQLYAQADFIICDSRIIQKLSYFLGDSSIKNVVPGSDLTKFIFERISASSKSVCIVGPCEADVDKVRHLYSVNNIRCIEPSMGFINRESEVKQIVYDIISYRSDIVFLAVGSPQQEVLAVNVKKRIRELGADYCPYILCIGASIDFISGKTARAPVFVQKLHLEWLHRALSDPTRLIPRYWKNFVWLSKLVFKKLVIRI
ncbi:WecB/TagA/CpsF family glycosyltransferase [Rheinheimera sp.]|uniref:WecB/TagA/CpsF family glycosyltransferase n=1 Tax=Rheinheimera sp. TaxID=1869214 RepID=UPI003AF59514